MSLEAERRRPGLSVCPEGNRRRTDSLSVGRVRSRFRENDEEWGGDDGGGTGTKQLAPRFPPRKWG